MTVYGEILSWSKGLHPWQRDTLRRLLIGPIEAAQMAELEALALKQFGLDVPGYEGLAAIPLAEDHLPQDGVTGDDVLLQVLMNVKNVNIIASDSIVEFGPKGLTVIYGYNGSGKSGYVRVLKRMCRSRDVGAPICPNVFEDYDGSPASATVGYSCGEVETVYDWVDGTAGPSELSRISVFDASSAESYVVKENDVAYRPFGLDLFDKLATVADALHRNLEHRKQTLALLCPNPPNEIANVPELKGIFPITSKTDLTKIEAIPPLSPSEVKEQQVLSLRQELPSVVNTCLDR